MDQAQIIAEATTLAVCVPLAPVLMVTVAVYGWPSWWLVVAGVLAAWIADALRALAGHTMTVLAARRQLRTPHTHESDQHEDRCSAGDPR